MTAHVDTMRAFLALNVDVGSARRLAELAARLRAKPLAPKARWVAPTKMHLTLKFFGEIDVGLAPAIRDAVSGLAAAEPSPHVQLGGLTGFPATERARVIVVEVLDPSGALHALAATVDERTAPLGFVGGQRFRPHVTLARTYAPVDARDYLAHEASSVGEAVVTELVFYRSDLARSGAEYTAIARFGFAPEAPFD